MPWRWMWGTTTRAPSSLPAPSSAGAGTCTSTSASGMMIPVRTRPRRPRAPVGSPLEDAKQISAGLQSSCVTRADDTVSCWGFYRAWQGPWLGGDVLSGKPIVDVPGVSDVTSVTAGHAFQCAASRDGTARCWGINQSGTARPRRHRPQRHPGTGREPRGGQGHRWWSRARLRPDSDRHLLLGTQLGGRARRRNHDRQLDSREGRRAGAVGRA